MEMIQKLANSERVKQLFVRHVFRFRMGRNETINDAPILRDAYKAYRDSNGRMKALLTSLLPTLLAVMMLTNPVQAAQLGKSPVKVFILAGQSNMDGQADIRTIDFLGEDKDPARAALLKTFKPLLMATPELIKVTL